MKENANKFHLSDKKLRFHIVTFLSPFLFMTVLFWPYFEFLRLNALIMYCLFKVVLKIIIWGPKMWLKLKLLLLHFYQFICLDKEKLENLFIMPTSISHENKFENKAFLKMLYSILLFRNNKLCYLFIVFLVWVCTHISVWQRKEFLLLYLPLVIKI